MFKLIIFVKFFDANELFREPAQCYAEEQNSQK